MTAAGWGLERAEARRDTEPSLSCEEAAADGNESPSLHGGAGEKGVLLAGSVSAPPAGADSQLAAERLWGHRSGSVQYSKE